MAHRVSPEAETDLDEIWNYVATQSSSVEIADRLIDSITQRFLMLARYPHVGRSRNHDLRPGLTELSGRRIHHHLPRRR